jgi:hypothetical protein
MQLIVIGLFECPMVDDESRKKECEKESRRSGNLDPTTEGEHRGNVFLFN